MNIRFTRIKYIFPNKIYDELQDRCLNPCLPFYSSFIYLILCFSDFNKEFDLIQCHVIKNTFMLELKTA